MMFLNDAHADGRNNIHEALCGSFINASSLLSSGLICQANSLATNCSGTIKDKTRFGGYLPESKYTLVVNDYGYASVLNGQFLFPLPPEGTELDLGTYMNILINDYRRSYSSCTTVSVATDMSSLILECDYSKFEIAATKKETGIIVSCNSK